MNAKEWKLYREVARDIVVALVANAIRRDPEGRYPNDPELLEMSEYGVIVAHTIITAHRNGGAHLEVIEARGKAESRKAK